VQVCVRLLVALPSLSSLALVFAVLMTGAADDTPRARRWDCVSLNVRGNLFLEGPQPIAMVLSGTISQNRVAEMEVAGEREGR
jgi:hypothetical protein